jgi:adenosylhomocysteine nucleosidase
VKSVGILVAMWEEFNPLRKHWNLDWTGPGDFFSGKVAGLRVQVALSGVGPRHAGRAVQDLVKLGRPEVLISLGYSGALKDHLLPGDAIHAQEIETSDKKLYTSQQAGHRLLSVSNLAPTRGSKRQLAEQFPYAYAVDMESAVLAEAAESTGLPWRALRVIIDPLDSDLPIDFNRCVSRRGQTAPAKLAREIITHPNKIPALIEFGRWEKQARQQLIRTSTQLLETINS